MNHPQNFDRVLESAVVVSWADLMRSGQGGLIHVEYDFAPGGTLDHLQVWSSHGKGRWLLACGYRNASSKFHDTGVHFHNGYQSQGLARILELLISQQMSFTIPRNIGRAGLVQIIAPTQRESTAAAFLVNQLFNGINCVLPAPALA